MEDDLVLDQRLLRPKQDVSPLEARRRGPDGRVHDTARLFPMRGGSCLGYAHVPASGQA
jgi:hypothetical protein